MKRFLHQAWLSFKGPQAAFKMEEFLAFKTLYPLFTLIFYCVLAGYSFQTSNLTNWVVGNSFLLCVNTCIFSLGASFTGERYYGRIRFIIASPANKLCVILEKGFYPCFVAVLTVFLGFIAGGAIFHIGVSQVNLLAYLGIIIIAMVAATGFGLFIGVFGLVTDQMNFILNLVSNLLMIFCGADFPISQLPAWGRVMSKVLPLTRSIQAGNLLLKQAPVEQILPLLFEELCLAMVYFLLGAAIIKTVERIAIRKATLEVF